MGQRRLSVLTLPEVTHSRGGQVPRNAFYSFHYHPDCSRVAQVRNMGVIDGNAPVSDNAWEDVTKGGDAAIERWVESEMKGRSCAIVLIGSQTAGRKWVTYEIMKAWNSGKGVLGVYIHRLKNFAGEQATKGGNPFDYVTLNANGARLSTVVRTYDPPFADSKDAYNFIRSNLADWIETAIAIRNQY